MRIAIGSDVLMQTAARHSTQAHERIAVSVRHVASGKRVASAIDDAAGLAVAQRLRAQYESLFQASRNAQEGLNFLDIADGALTRTTDVLQRLRIIALQSATDTYTDTQRLHLQRAVDLSLDEIDAVAARTTYGGHTLLDGSRTAWHLQVGADAGQTLTIEVRAADRVALGLAPARDAADAETPADGADGADGVDADSARAPTTPALPTDTAVAPAQAAFAAAAGGGPLSVRTRDAAVTALDLLDKALAYVLVERAEFGAASNRLEFMIRTLGVSADAARAAEARITDADLPAEVATMVRAQIAAEVTAHMMARAQHAQALVLELLRPAPAVTRSATRDAATATTPPAPGAGLPTAQRAAPTPPGASFAGATGLAARTDGAASTPSPIVRRTGHSRRSEAPTGGAGSGPAPSGVAS